MTFYEHNIAKFANIYLYLIIASNILACLWNRIDVYDLMVDVEHAYIRGLHMFFETAATVGYGDVTIDDSEIRGIIGRYCFQLLMMYFGIVFTSLTYGLINQLVHRFQYVSIKTNAPVHFVKASSITLKHGCSLELIQRPVIKSPIITTDP